MYKLNLTVPPQRNIKAWSGERKEKHRDDGVRRWCSFRDPTTIGGSRIFKSTASHHRPFFRFAFKGWAYTVLPLGLSMAPHTFMKCMDAALSPLRLLQTHRSWFLSHLECLGLRINLFKSVLSPSKCKTFLGTVIDSVQMRAWLMLDRALSIQKLASSFKAGSYLPLRTFQRALGLMVASSSVLQLGLLHMGPLQCWLKLTRGGLATCASG